MQGIAGTFVALAALGLTLPAGAQTQGEQEQAESARRVAFRSGMEAIVADLNEEWYGSFVRSIDQSAMVERIFGLRLIDQQVKRGFTENLDYTWEQFIAAQFPEDEEQGLQATLLGVESRGDRGRAVVRFDLPKFQFNYHEYDLRLDGGGNLVIVDWTDYLGGKVFSEDVGEYLVAGMASDSALRKLLDFNNPTQAELFRFRELLKAARDNQLPRYLEIFEQLPEKYQRQRIVVESKVQLAKRLRKRREMLAGLEAMAKYYPNEPLYGLMLLDHYFPRKQFAEATQALQRVYDRIGFPDAAMEARLSAARLAAGYTEEALAHAERALQLESDLELAWWSALNARATVEDYAASVEALTVLEDAFMYALDPETLGRNPVYRGLVGSDEYRDWRAKRSP